MSGAEAPLRVLYVDNSIAFGGSFKSLALTLRALPEVEALVLTPQSGPLVEAWLPRHRTRGFRRIVNYRSTRRARGWVAARLGRGLLGRLGQHAVSAADLAVTLKNCLWLAGLIRRRRIDIIHLNNGFTPLEALLAARLTGVPCIAHLRDFLGHRPRFDLPAVAFATHVLSISHAVSASLAGTPAPADRVTVVYDPVDVELMERAAVRRASVRAEWGLADGEVAVGIFGRVMWWKGQMEFVRAALRAMERDPSLRAVIVGDQADGDTGYFDEVRRAIDESGLAGRFVLAGYRHDVEACYAAMDVVVHASITPEPFGMVVPEAMAAGRAVVATDAGGPREVIENGINGLLVPPGDVDALAGAIALLADDAPMRARLGAAGRETAARRFRVEANAAQVAALYATLARRPAAPCAAPRPEPARG